MLKKAGIVVLGTAASVMSLSGMAFAGESHTKSDSDDDRGHSHHHDHDGDHDGGKDDHGREGGSCDKIAYSSGDSLVKLDNLASNLDVSHLNILAKDDSIEAGGCAGRGGDKYAVSEGDSLVSAANVLSNADLRHVNVLAKDGSLSL